MSPASKPMSPPPVPVPVGPDSDVELPPAEVPVPEPPVLKLWVVLVPLDPQCTLDAPMRVDASAASARLRRVFRDEAMGSPRRCGAPKGTPKTAGPSPGIHGARGAEAHARG